MKITNRKFWLVAINVVFLIVFLFSLGNLNIFSDARSGIAVLGVHITLNMLAIILTDKSDK